MKKILSIALIAMLTLSLSGTAFAADTTPGLGDHDVPIWVTAEASVMDVSIPTPSEFLIAVNADGTATGPLEMTIVNNGSAPVKITAAQYKNNGIWSLTSLSTVQAAAVNGKKFTGKIKEVNGFVDDTAVTGGEILASLNQLVGLELLGQQSGVASVGKILFEENAWKGSLSDVAVETAESGGTFVFTFN